MSNGDDPVLDPQAVLRSFSSSFRGYDSDQVDKHLRSIADALRTKAGVADSSGAELESARSTIEQLTAAVNDLERQVAVIEASPPVAVPVAEAAPFDEARAMQLLGEETTRVLETARQSASTLVANAEAEARRRTEAVDQLQAQVNADMADLRKTTDTQLAEARAKQERELAEAREAIEGDIAARETSSKNKAEALVVKASEDAARIVAEAQAEADKLAEGASGAASVARDEAAALVVAATTEAGDLRSSAEAAATTAKAEAVTDAARIRAEAEADALAAQESARETARLMVVEAQRVREKVLNDLVVRRRQGRQQVDQAKAARDRLGRALLDVRRQLESSVKELDVALPEAKAALSALATPDAPTDDEAQIRELEIELDAARARAGQNDVVVASGSAALAPARHKRNPVPAAAPVEPEVGEVDEASGAESKSAVAADDEAVVEINVDDSSEDGEADAPEQEPVIEVPDAFLARDVAMTRHGADLRRKLKRVMADEQSDLLDRLQRSKAMSMDDLAPADDQRALYLAAVTPAIIAAADLGADLYGGSIKPAKVQPLIDKLVSDVFDPLRQRVEGSVKAGADVDDVLEPLRAHYRDVRLSDVPDLTDDVLAEAFALGGYSAISKGTPIRWMSDPRFEPNSDCFDDTLANDVVAPDPFPTGRRHPTGQPGCRCLVVPWP